MRQLAVGMPLGDDLAGRADGVDDVILAGADDLQANAVMPGETRQRGTGVIVGIANLCHVAQLQMATIATGNQRQGGEVLFQIGLLGCFELQVHAVIAQYRGCGAGGVGVDRLLHVGQRQAVGLQARFVDLDGHHRVQPAGEVDLADAGIGKQFRAQALGQALQAVAIGIAIQLQANGVGLALRFFDDRFVGVGGKVGDRVHLRFDVAQQDIEVVVGLFLHRNGGTAAGRGAGQRLDTDHVLQRVLDLDR